MHDRWIERGFAYIGGQEVPVPEDFAARTQLCPVDHWLRERLDERLKTLPLYEVTLNLHEHFHEALDKLFQSSPPTLEARANFERAGSDLRRCLEAFAALGRGSIAPA